jgi:hypothetical protein
MTGKIGSISDIVNYISRNIEIQISWALSNEAGEQRGIGGYRRATRPQGTGRGDGCMSWVLLYFLLSIDARNVRP